MHTAELWGTLDAATANVW